MACIATHIDDVWRHSELKAKNHNRLMSLTVVFISARLLKSGRLIFKKLGTLITILAESIPEFIVWGVLYVVIWLSFSKKILQKSLKASFYNFSYNSNDNVLKRVHFGWFMVE